MTLKTLSDFLSELKTEYPTLTKGINDETIDLTNAEYEATIKAWAEDRFAKQIEEQNLIAAEEAKAKAVTDKAALLKRLGITADEAVLLLS